MERGECTELIKVPRVCCGCNELMGHKLVAKSATIEGKEYITHGICDKCGRKLYPQHWGKEK
jgi:hypothetical protein